MDCDDIKKLDEVLPSLTNVRGEGCLKTILLFYIDVGQLPPFNAEKFLDRMKDRWKPVVDRLPEHVGVLYIPVRGVHSRVEIVHLAQNTVLGLEDF